MIDSTSTRYSRDVAVRRRPTVTANDPVGSLTSFPASAEPPVLTFAKCRPTRLKVILSPGREINSFFSMTAFFEPSVPASCDQNDLRSASYTMVLSQYSGIFASMFAAVLTFSVGIARPPVQTQPLRALRHVCFQY